MFGIGSKGAPRPVPRPGTPAAAAQPPGGGFFGGMSPQSRHDLTMGLLANMGGYLGENAAPMAHFLAPIATALIGGRAESNLAAAKEAARADAMQTLGAAGFGGGRMAPDQLTALLDLSGDELVDDPIRSIARSMITTGMRPMPQGRSGGGRSRGGGSSSGGGSGSPYDSISAAMAGRLLNAEDTIREAAEGMAEAAGISVDEARERLRAAGGYDAAFALSDRYARRPAPAADAPVVGAPPPAVPETPAPQVNVPAPPPGTVPY